MKDTTFFKEKSLKNGSIFPKNTPKSTLKSTCIISWDFRGGSDTFNVWKTRLFLMKNLWKVSLFFLKNTPKTMLKSTCIVSWDFGGGSDTFNVWKTRLFSMKILKKSRVFHTLKASDPPPKSQLTIQVPLRVDFRVFF